MTESKLYAVGRRECWKLGDHYTRHSLAMTAEGLHKKSDIAAELAVRDAEIERLRNALQQSIETTRDWLKENAPGGWIDQLRVENTQLRQWYAEVIGSVAPERLQSMPASSIAGSTDG